METLIETGNSKLLKFSQFLTNSELEELTEPCLNLPLIERPEIKIYGKICRQQRNVGFFAKPGVAGYKYSGQQTNVVNIDDFPFLRRLMDSVNTELNSNFNGILVNLYENGERYISPHSDDENGLAPVGVASIAFGAVRTFRIRYKHSKQIVKDVQHYPGDLLVMTGNFQKEFTHEIPVQKKVTLPRVSLTFRLHK